MRYSILVLVLAITVGGLYAAPQLLIRQAVLKQELPFVLSQFTNLHDGGDVYFQLAREVVDGHFPPYDIFFDGTLPNISTPLPAVLLAGVLFIFKDINFAYIAANFLFSAILFLLFFLLGWVVFDKNKIWSVFMGLAGTLTPIAIHLPYAFLSVDNLANIVLKNFYPGVKTLLPTLFLARVNYPLITHLIYLPAIIVFFIFWHKPKLSTAIAAGFFSGLLSYTYFHKWVYWVTVVGLSFLYVLLFNRRHRQLLRNFFFLIGTSIVTSLPYFVNYFRLRNFPGGTDLIKRVGLEVGYGFNSWTWPYLAFFAVLAILIYSTFWKKDDLRPRAVLYWLYLLAGAIVLNIQVVLGFVPHSDHWPRAVSPIIFLILLNMFYVWFGKLSLRQSEIRVFIPVLLIGLSLLLITKKIINVYGFISPPREVLQDYVFPKRFTESWRWLDTHLIEPQVVSPSFLNSIYLTAFTSTRPALPVGALTAAPNFEMEELFLAVNNVFGVSDDILEKRLRDGRGLECLENCGRYYTVSNIIDAPLSLYGSYFGGGDNVIGQRLSESKVQELKQRYQKTRVDWADLGADYVYYGPWEKQFAGADLSRDQKLRLVYKNESVELYQIK